MTLPDSRIGPCAARVVLLAVALVTPACASTGRRAAIKVADDGVVAAKQTEALLIQTAGTLQPYVEGQFMLAPIRGTEPPGEDLLKNVRTVERALALRVRVMANLAKAYLAMKDHATYDSTAAVERSVSDLTGSVNAYAALLSAGTTLIPNTAAFVLAKASGAIAGAKQMKELKAASFAIRDRIEKFRGVLAKEAALLQSIRRVTDSTTATNALVLWNLGLGQPDVIVHAYLASFGLQYDPKQFVVAMKELEKETATGPTPEGCTSPCNSRADRLRFGVAQVVRQRVNRTITLDADIVDKHADALKTLEDAHRDFEADRFVDHAAVAAELEALKAIVDELVKLRSQ